MKLKLKHTPLYALSFWVDEDGILNLEEVSNCNQLGELRKYNPKQKTYWQTPQFQAQGLGQSIYTSELLDCLDKEYLYWFMKSYVQNYEGIDMAGKTSAPPPQI